MVNAGLYSAIFSPDLFKEYTGFVEDFAKVSNFREFYRENQSYYQKRIQKCKEKVPVKKMWNWLENNFPQRYDCYKVIFSPLIQGMHHTERFETRNDYVLYPRKNKKVDGLYGKVHFIGNSIERRPSTYEKNTKE